MQTHPPKLGDSDIASLERATLDAVAPQAVEALHGWLLPFDHSTIGRAKSAVPLSHTYAVSENQAGIHASQLQNIEARYAAHDLPAAFRVADLPGLAALHTALRQRHYRAQQPTLVQIASAAHLRQTLAASGITPAPVFNQPVAEWAAVYLAEGFDPVDGAHRVQALSRSTCVVYACMMQAGRPMAAGTAAFSQGWGSIHGMRTIPVERGRGLASSVLLGLADAAIARGLDRVFLQVEEDNTSARGLYERIGFSTAWRYHYWRHG
ncbi:MAG: GNAT family N-acetyltransferase [Rhodoferax sp.]|nr:GNAT family N-acetyltransferase [Rhodoferax sp.]